MDLIPWILNLLWIAIALTSIMSERSTRREADKWWKALQESHDAHMKTIEEYKQFAHRMNAHFTSQSNAR